MFRNLVSAAATVCLAATVMANGPAGEDYYPLQQGNTWRFRAPNGAEMVIQCVGVEPVKGIPCAVVATQTAQGKTMEWVARDGEGVKIHKSRSVQGESEPGVPTLQIKLPFRAGETWETPMQMGGSVKARMESAGRETVKVPAGTFACIKVGSTFAVGGNQMRGLTWYANGIGPVRMSLSSGQQELVLDLVQTNVRAGAGQAAATPPGVRGEPIRPAGGGVGLEPIILQRVTLTDQNDGKPAFTLLAPPTWQVGCSIQYRMDRPVAPADMGICARSADGLEEFNMLPQVWATWSAYLARNWNKPQYAGNELRQCPNDAAAFFQQLVLPRFRPGVRDITVVETQYYPEMAQTLTRAAPQGAGSSLKAQVARIRVEYRDPRTGQVMQEDIGGTLWVGHSANGFSNWMADKVYAYRAPKGMLGRRTDLITCMASSVQPDPNWMARYRRAIATLLQSEAETSAAVMERSRIIARNGAETAKIISDSYWNRQRTLDRTNAGWSQAMRGTAMYNTPYENYPVELPNGYDRVWTNGKGQYMLRSDGVDPNLGTNQTWTEIHRIR